MGNDFLDLRDFLRIIGTMMKEIDEIFSLVKMLDLFETRIRSLFMLFRVSNNFKHFETLSKWGPVRNTFITTPAPILSKRWTNCLWLDQSYTYIQSLGTIKYCGNEK